MKLSKQYVTRAVLAVAAIVATVMIIANFGNALLPTPFAPVNIDGPTHACSDGRMSAIVDSESRRVLILNENDELAGIADCTMIDAPFESVTDVSISGDYAYVSGIKTRPDSSIIEKERVVPYAHDGSRLSPVYEIDDNHTGIPAITSLCDAASGITAIVSKPSLAEESQPIQFISITQEGSKEVRSKTVDNTVSIRDSSCDPEAQDHHTLSVRGVIADDGTKTPLSFPDRVFTTVDQGTDALYACDDRSGALCKVVSDSSVREIVPGEGYQDAHVIGETLALCDRDSNTVMLCDTEGNVKKSLTSVSPSLGYSLRTAGVWLSVLFLVVLVIVLAVRKVRRELACGNTRGLGVMLTSLAIMVTVGAAALFVSFTSYERSVQTRMNEIGMCADHLESVASSLSASMEKANDRSALRKTGDELDQVISGIADVAIEVGSLTTAAQYNDIGLYYTVYGKDDQGVFYVVSDIDNPVFGMSVTTCLSEDAIEEAFKEGANYKGKLLSGLAQRDVTHYRLVPIPTEDGKGTAGVIEIGCSTLSFIGSIYTDIAHRVLALFIVAMVVYLTYTELRACGRCLFAYETLRKRHQHDALATLTRPFTLCITLLSSIDGVMTALIARDLLKTSGMDGSGFLVSLPSIMLGAGLVIGQGLYAYTGTRVNLRRLITAGAACMMGFALATAAVVSFGNFWMYCVAKLAMSVPFGLLYSLGYSLPRVAKSDETRELAAGGVKRTDTSAAVLGTVLGGYASQLLGNAWVYVIVALACLPIMSLALGKLAKADRPLERRQTNMGPRSNLLHFVRSPLALMLALLIIFPTTVALGYTSFIFPLFSADVGVSKSDINNIYALGQVVVFASISGIEALDARYGKWRTSTTAMALVGLTFLLFAINTTFVWSLVVVVIVGVLCKQSDGWKAMWLHAAKQAGVEASPATGAMFCVRSLALTARPFLLGALLSATNTMAVIVLGALCLVCTGAFYLLSRRTCLPST